MHSFLVGVVCLAGASSVYFWQHIRKRLAQREHRGSHQLPLPPGPKPKPVIGNLLDIPLSDGPKVFSEWRNLYGQMSRHLCGFLPLFTLLIGDLIYIEAFHQRVLVLGSLEAANDLLAKKSAIYSDRPGLVMLGELIGLDQVGIEALAPSFQL